MVEMPTKLILLFIKKVFPCTLEQFLISDVFGNYEEGPTISQITTSHEREMSMLHTVKYLPEETHSESQFQWMEPKAESRQ